MYAHVEALIDLWVYVDAYIQLIREANHTIYIENQFFVTSTGKDYPVKNQIGAALVERIISAAKDGRNFRVSAEFHAKQRSGLMMPQPR